MLYIRRVHKQARDAAAARAARHYEAITPPHARARLTVGRRDDSYAYRLGAVRGIVISPATCRDATDAELRGELRHEQAHLADRWPVAPALLMILIAVALAVLLVMQGPGAKASSDLASLAMTVLPPIAFAAYLAAARVKRGREYAADARAAQTDTGYSDIVAMLDRLERLWPTPAHRSWMTRLTATHPTVPERLAALCRQPEPTSGQPVFTS